jgi:hypothetical protein
VIKDYLDQINNALWQSDYCSLQRILGKLKKESGFKLPDPQKLNHSQLANVAQMAALKIFGACQIDEETQVNIRADWTLVGDQEYYLTDLMKRYKRQKVAKNCTFVLELKSVYSQDFYWTFGSDALTVYRASDLDIFIQ